MFQKLVANAPFSPALVGQLGFYARRLKREELTRRLGLVFTALALIVQSFAVFAPPESANAANESDMIRGGISNKRELLDAYDKSARGNGDFKDIMDYAGVTREELANMTEGTLNSKSRGTGDGAWKSWGRTHRFSGDQGEVKHVIPKERGGTSTVYSKPLWLYDSKSYTIKNGSSYPALFGTSKKLGKFAIMKDCGNLVTTSTPKPAPRANFISATCSTITGQAYDARNQSRDVKVYLYFGGPPGKGEKSRAINANLNGNKFSYDVPHKYKVDNKSTKVWGVMIPLAGWGSPSVQFKNTAIIPGNCEKPEISKPTPSANCTTLSLKRVSRTTISLQGASSVANGATVKAYSFSVKDKDGKTVATKKVSTNKASASSGDIEIKKDGTYTATLSVATSVGDKTSQDCIMKFSIAPVEKCPLNQDINKNDDRCKPCPDSTNLWAEDPACQPETVHSKTGINLTREKNAEEVTARAGDRIEYTIYAENTGQVPATIALDEDLRDVSEYAQLQNNGGGKYNDDNHVLSWGSVTLQPGEKQSRSFVVRMLDELPTTPQGTSEPGSYDCVMTNAFGNTVTTKVDCQGAKIVEQTVKELPSTGPTANIIFSTALLAIVTYFWARAKQLGREVRLVRKEINAGVV